MLRALHRWSVAALLASTAFVWSLHGQAPPPKQAVVETSAGTVVLDLMPDAAPNTVAYFTKDCGDRRL